MSRVRSLFEAMRAELAECHNPFSQRFLQQNEVSDDEYMMLCGFLERACEEVLHRKGNVFVEQQAAA